MKFPGFEQLEKDRKKFLKLRKKGITPCFVCWKPMLQEDEYTWRTTCGHNPNLRLHIG